jgi:UDP-2-acetamido-2,6-beta-L-arabino-hexul-4-ose reductase
MKVLITGYKGFIGTNLLENLTNEEIYLYDRENNFEELKLFIKYSDVIVHLAAEVRNNALVDDFNVSNIDLTQFIVEEMNKYKNKLIIFSSTIHAINPTNTYGVSKKLSEEYIIDNLKKNNRYKIFRFNHLFGAYAKPNHNSVLTTWICAALRGEDLVVYDSNYILKYSYIQDVIITIKDCIHKLDRNEIITFNKYYTISLGVLKNLILDIVSCDKSTLFTNDKMKDEFILNLIQTINYYKEKDGC